MFSGVLDVSNVPDISGVSSGLDLPDVPDARVVSVVESVVSSGRG